MKPDLYPQRVFALPFVILMTVALCFGVPLTAFANELPISLQKSVGIPLEQVQKVTAPAKDLDRLRAEDRQAEASSAALPTRFAAAVPVAIESLGAGTWQQLDDGSRLWRLRVSSPGAKSLNLHFDRFELPPTARLWIYSPDASRIDGPFSDKGLGELWTPIVLGDEMVVEVHVPAAAAFEPSLRLAAVNHGYRMFGETNKQGSCNNDVVCPEGDAWRPQIRSVAVYSRNGVFACTGTLMNNTSGDLKPYFLTAEHCGVTTGNDQSLVIYWNYESPFCGTLGNGSLADNQSGTTWRAAWDRSDFTLLELDDTPPTEFNVYYAGWDASNAPVSSAVGIHHPSTDEKAISFENSALQNFDLYNDGDLTHWLVNDWEDGTTEPGSSGSCIFDANSKLCVGTLTGGFAACGNNLQDWYGKMSRHWTGNGTSASRLSNWLDPGNTGATTQTGAGPGGCSSDNETLCLRNNRFSVKVDWRTSDGTIGTGKVVPFGSSDSGMFYFFFANNWEMLIKVLDGCSINDRYWVYFAATTDAEFTVTVTDTRTEVTETYFNPLGNPADAVTDTQAFATCP